MDIQKNTKFDLSRLEKQLSVLHSQQSAVLELSSEMIVFTRPDLTISAASNQFKQRFNCPETAQASLPLVLSGSKTTASALSEQFIQDIENLGQIDCIIATKHRGNIERLRVRGKLFGDAETAEIVWILDTQCDQDLTQDPVFPAGNIYLRSSAAILIMDANFKIIDVNPAFRDTTGYSLAELAKLEIFDLFVDLEHKQDIIDAIAGNNSWRGELNVSRKPEDCFPAMVLLDPLEVSGKRPGYYLVLFLDISDHKELENELRYHAEIDPLTGLANRKLFFQQFENSLALAKRFNDSVALLYLDLDGFKQVNDSFGHGQGDNVLIEVSQRLKRCLREVDTVARLGGDEFVIILNRTSKTMVADTAQRIIDTLALDIHENDRTLRVTASIGIAIYPDHGLNPKTLLKLADAAMYKAKLKGKHQYCWHNCQSE